VEDIGDHSSILQTRGEVNNGQRISSRELESSIHIGHFVVFPAAYHSFSNGVFNSAVHKARSLAAKVPVSNLTCFLNRSKFSEHNHRLGITQYFAPATKEDRLKLN